MSLRLSSNLQRFLIVNILLNLASSLVFSQDLMVTSSGDTLNCKITDIGEEYIRFIFKHQNEVRHTLIAREDVTFYQQNYYKNQPDQFLTSNKSHRRAEPLYRLALHGGWSRRTAKLPSGMDPMLEDYADELKTGQHLSADLSWFRSEALGFGAGIIHFETNNRLRGITVTWPDGSSTQGEMSDDIAIDFLGPIVTTRTLNTTRTNGMILQMGIGYLTFKDVGQLVEKLTLTGNTVGVYMGIGYDLPISKSYFVSFQASMVGGTLSKVEISDGVHSETIALPKDEKESLNRVDLSLGISYIW